jgi:hypothetical protein
MVKTVTRLGCTSLTLLGGVIETKKGSTHPEDYAAHAKTGIFKKIYLPDGRAVPGKMAVMVLDGVGPLAAALSRGTKKTDPINQALWCLALALVKAVEVGRPVH